ncbi:hypothetical protein DFH07DRAFT_740870 [Mycena maculata]|uniref:ZNF598/HEL2 PAH domain-containing protein n=1 Tax=Mycena maculata TaxID=230809 RepID=A0AAD7J9I8_9AGAR|nr:hypothetical protein DFH07DRAFT_740870 [Mycena maculata]
MQYERAAIRSFLAAKSSARDLISMLWSVVDARMESAASIINAFVDLLEEGEQREAVLAAWRGFEIKVSCALISHSPISPRKV